jgi:serine/threonine-protein kinase
MVWVPAGEFEMGEREEARMRYVPGFYIDRHEVSRAEYDGETQAQECDPMGANEMALPMVDLTWEQADAYCRSIGKQLPTEEQWEKAARGVDGRWYPWGDEPPTRSLANLGTGEPSCRGSHSLGQSPYGAEDMVGNVFEFAAAQDGPLVRGGGWSGSARFGYSAFRAPHSRSDSGLDIGFRCVQFEEAPMEPMP